MLVQYSFPQVITPLMLDNYLSEGWFRSSASMYHTKVFSLDQKLHEVINIRLPLKNYEPKKRLRRIKRKVHEAFEVVVRPFENSPEKELLYKNHKHRFRGYLQETLFSFLKGDDEERQHLSIFDTYEVCIYDGEKLIGFSIFDVGHVSIASILGIFDATYHQYSIGLFTMLQEIEYAQSIGYQYYYPGYILSKTRVFDYKLRLGKMEYYNQLQQWQAIDELHTLEPISDLIESKIEGVKQLLQAYNVPSVKMSYPLFPLGYFDFVSVNFVRGPIFLLLFEAQMTDNALLLEYWQEEDEFVISQIELHEGYGYTEQLDFEEKPMEDISYCIDILSYNFLITRSSNLMTLIEDFTAYLESLQS